MRYLLKDILFKTITAHYVVDVTNCFKIIFKRNIKIKI